jgi:MoxR-like ATPase
MSPLSAEPMVGTVVTLVDGIFIDMNGNNIGKDVPQNVKAKLRAVGGSFELGMSTTGKPRWNWSTNTSTISNKAASMSVATTNFKDGLSGIDKPSNLIISNLKWKYLVRSVLRGKNIMMTGPSGCGKTLAVQSVAGALPERPFYYFNLGATQDPRSTLIGNTHYSKDVGTFVADALFVQAIQTPNAIILMDELTRANPDAWNILITVLDENQRYLRIDEHPSTPTIKVADGVTFIATANIGLEYTGTRVLDRAMLDRFAAIVEMEPLAKDEEIRLLILKYPTLDTNAIMAIADIAHTTRQQVKSDDPKVSTSISSRLTVEMAGLINDGFTLEEAAEVCIYPFFSEAGGVDSERTFMRQLVQKYIPSTLDADTPLYNQNF